jgi:hypothetical protein
MLMHMNEMLGHAYIYLSSENVWNHEGYNLVLWEPFFHKSPLIAEYQKR